MMDVPSDGAYVSADFPNKVERWVKFFAMRMFLFTKIITKIMMIFMIRMVFMITMVIKTWIITRIMMLIT